MSQGQKPFEAYLGKVVVLDCAAPFVYLGRLERVEHDYLVLADADVHDLRDSDSTRELYVRDSSIHGVRRNRKQVTVRMDAILSVSLLEDVTDY